MNPQRESNVQNYRFIFLVKSGDLSSIQKHLSKNKNLLNKVIEEYPPIYHAVKAGHYNVVQFFLKNGCNTKYDGHKSTPMHCAAYYGHYKIILLLLEYGVDTQVKNFEQKLPIEESATDEIKRLLKNAKKNKLNELNKEIIKYKIGFPIINIFQNGQIKVKKILLKKYFSSSYKNYVDAFHGTNFDALFSIAVHGLRRPGDNVDGKQLGVVPGHIPLNQSFQGKQNWSKAIFASPSIFYAAHPVYSKEVNVDGKETWLPLVQVKVKSGSYSSHDHTLKAYNVKNNESVSLEFKVKCPGNQSNLIMRTENSDAVKVVALIFIKKGFLDECDSYIKTTKMMLDSPEEQLFRKSINI